MYLFVSYDKYCSDTLSSRQLLIGAHRGVVQMWSSVP